MEGYKVCMKRIIKFASRLDMFREFCSEDQRNLLICNTDMLVNIRSARMLRPGSNLQDQISVVFGLQNNPSGSSSGVLSRSGGAGAQGSSGKAGASDTSRLNYKQVYSSPWASGEDQEEKFFALMSNIFQLRMDQTTTALIGLMALFSQV